MVVGLFFIRYAKRIFIVLELSMVLLFRDLMSVLGIAGWAYVIAFIVHAVIGFFAWMGGA